MISRADSRALLTFTKDFTSSNFVSAMGRLNTAGLSITTDGIGTTTATSTTVQIPMAGFADQRVVATMKYITPTAQGAESLGVVLRCQTLEVTGDTSYYYIRLDAGVAKISRFLNSSTTNTTLTQSAWVMAQNTNFTIDAQVVGSTISATFTSSSGTPSPVTISAVDTNITAPGFILVRTTASTGFFSTISAYQL